MTVAYFPSISFPLEILCWHFQLNWLRVFVRNQRTFTANFWFQFEMQNNDEFNYVYQRLSMSIIWIARAHTQTVVYSIVVWRFSSFLIYFVRLTLSRFIFYWILFRSCSTQTTVTEHTKKKRVTHQGDGFCVEITSIVLSTSVCMRSSIPKKIKLVVHFIDFIIYRNISSDKAV